MAQTLSHVGATPGGGVAHMRLDLVGTTLADCGPLVQHVHLQEVSLPGNCITSLRGLGALRQLHSLDASSNRLTQVGGWAGGGGGGSGCLKANRRLIRHKGACRQSESTRLPLPNRPGLAAAGRGGATGGAVPCRPVIQPHHLCFRPDSLHQVCALHYTVLVPPPPRPRTAP